MNRQIALVLTVCAVLALAVTGCSAQRPESVGSAKPPEAASHIAPEDTVEPVGGVSEMPAKQKTAELNSSFVTEWPVAAGTVLSAKTVSENELAYVLSVPAPAAAVEQWYRTVMRGRAFVLTDESQADDGTVILSYARANLTYAVQITPESASTTRVLGTLISGSTR